MPNAESSDLFVSKDRSSSGSDPSKSFCPLSSNSGRSDIARVESSGNGAVQKLMRSIEITKQLSREAKDYKLS